MGVDESIAMLEAARARLPAGASSCTWPACRSRSRGARSTWWRARSASTTSTRARSRSCSRGFARRSGPAAASCSPTWSCRPTPADAVTGLTPGFDKPSTLAEQLQWLQEAGSAARVTWQHRDLAVVRSAGRCRLSRRRRAARRGRRYHLRPVSADLPPDFFNRPLAEVDPEIAEVLALELERQQRTLEMIASENFAPAAVLECQGSVLSNKYAEGYPGRRYYGGCEHVDVAEQLAIDRAKALFGAEHANVQPHAGAQANTAVYHALLQPGDALMGLELSHGGHLSHGMKINVSGRLYEIVAYHVDRETSLIDMDEVERLATSAGRR